MSELDLDKLATGGGGDEGQREAQREQRRERKPEDSKARTRRRHDAEVRERLGNVFERLAEWRESRGDEELAAIIREDARSMTAGFVSLTRNLPVVRAVVLNVLAFLEPVLAFGRLVRVVVGRWQVRRWEAAAQAEAETVGEPAAEPEDPWRRGQ